MGGEYVSEWNVGSDFGRKWWDGEMYTSGKIVEIEPEKLLKHTLFDKKNPKVVTSVISYRLENDGDTTTLFAREELRYEMTDQEYDDAVEGRDGALEAVKSIAENL